MAESSLPMFPKIPEDVRYAVGGNTQTAYADSTLYYLLKNSPDIHPDKIQFFVMSFSGGIRTGMCYLYSDKLYGWVMATHFSSAPRIFTVSNGSVTLRQFATS